MAAHPGDPAVPRQPVARHAGRAELEVMTGYAFVEDGRQFLPHTELAPTAEWPPRASGSRQVLARRRVVGGTRTRAGGQDRVDGTKCRVQIEVNTVEAGDRGVVLLLQPRLVRLRRVHIRRLVEERDDLHVVHAGLDRPLFRLDLVLEPIELFPAPLVRLARIDRVT